MSAIHFFSKRRSAVEYKPGGNPYPQNVKGSSKPLVLHSLSHKTNRKILPLVLREEKYSASLALCWVPVHSAFSAWKPYHSFPLSPSYISPLLALSVVYLVIRQMPPSSILFGTAREKLSGFSGTSTRHGEFYKYTFSWHISCALRCKSPTDKPGSLSLTS